MSYRLHLAKMATVGANVAFFVGIRITRHLFVNQIVVMMMVLEAQWYKIMAAIPAPPPLPVLRLVDKTHGMASNFLPSSIPLGTTLFKTTSPGSLRHNSTGLQRGAAP